MYAIRSYYVDLETLDRRPLLHRNDQRVAILAHLDVIEEALGIERANRFANPHVIDGIADVDRQVIEDGTLGYPLQTLDSYNFV